MSGRKKSLDPYFKTLVKNVDKYGWQATGVQGEQYAGEENLPFAYTIGLWRTFSHPELFISGVPTESGMAVLDVAASLVKQGEKFVPGARSSNLLNGYDAVFVDAPWEVFSKYGLSVKWFYHVHLDGDEPIPVLQVVWPSPGEPTSYPWESTWLEAWHGRQVLLGRPPVSNYH
jgi:hypothetical protein